MRIVEYSIRLICFSHSRGLHMLYVHYLLLCFYFCKETHKMISTCDTNLAEWTANGNMFVVKDQTRFAHEVIPEYFEHSKFASFARQLNFYGFNKIQTKPIKHSDRDKSTMHHVTYCNENFKRDALELLFKIQRSTKGPNVPHAQDQQRQIASLKGDVELYKGEVQQLNDRIAIMERRFSNLEKQLNLDQTQSSQSLKYRYEQGQRFHNNISGTSVDFEGCQLSNPDEILPPPDEVAYDCNPIPISTPNTTTSNSFIKLSSPTLGFHPNTKRNGHLPPGSVPLPSSQRVPSQAFSTGNASFLRGLSNESTGLDPFEKNLLTLLMDDKDNGLLVTEPNDGTSATSSQNSKLASGRGKSNIIDNDNNSDNFNKDSNKDDNSNGSTNSNNNDNNDNNNDNDNDSAELGTACV